MAIDVPLFEAVPQAVLRAAEMMLLPWAVRSGLLRRSWVGPREEKPDMLLPLVPRRLLPIENTFLALPPEPTSAPGPQPALPSRPPLLPAATKIARVGWSHTERSASRVVCRYSTWQPAMH